MLINGDSLSGINIESLLSQIQSGIKGDDSSGSDFAEKLLEQFDLIDTDKNSELSKKELSTMENYDFGNLIPDDLITNFNKYDEDGNGEFSKNEFKIALGEEIEQYSSSTNGFSGLIKSISSSTLANTFIDKLLSSYSL